MELDRPLPAELDLTGLVPDSVADPVSPPPTAAGGEDDHTPGDCAVVDTSTSGDDDDDDEGVVCDDRDGDAIFIVSAPPDAVWDALCKTMVSLASVLLVVRIVKELFVF